MRVTVVKTLQCDCGGTMSWTGVKKGSVPGVFLHKCDDESCGKKAKIRGASYPKELDWEVDPDQTTLG